MARKFVSPGVFTQEIDQSFLAQGVANIGAGIIGLTQKGAAFAPVTVSDFNGFVANFGDVDPLLMAPYAAKNYLKNSSTMQMVRVLGSSDGKTLTETANVYSDAIVDASGNILAIVSMPLGTTLAWGAGTASVIAGLSSSSAAVRYAAKTAGAAGNSITITYSSSSWVTSPVSVVGTAITMSISGPLAPNGGDVQRYINSSAAAFALVSATVLTSATLTVAAAFAALTGGIDYAGPTYQFVGTTGVFTSSYPSSPMTASMISNQTNYIGKVFNTDPTQIATYGHFLYKNFEWSTTSMSGTTVRTSEGSGAPYATADLFGTGSNGLAIFDTDYTSPNSPWMYSQNFGTDAVPKRYDLFQFWTMGDGAASNTDVKVSIDNIRASPFPTITAYGTFDIIVRIYSDTDKRLNQVESYSNVSLDPASAQYLPRVIGDQYVVWNTTSRKLNVVGTYKNRSKYIGVTMGPAGAPPTALPWGHSGYPEIRTVSTTGTISGTIVDVPFIMNNLDSQGNPFTGAYWGIDLSKTGVSDRLKFTFANGTGLATVTQGAILDLGYLSASSSAGTSWTVYNSTGAGTSTGTMPSTTAQRGFTVAFYGGFDGWDPTQVDPLSNSIVSVNGTKASIALKLAVDTLSNPDEIDLNLLAIPGIYAPNVTQYARQMCNDRADCMMIMDIGGGSVSDAISQITNQGVDDNYAACYYPHLRYADATNGVLVDVPPSVAVLGAFAYSDRVGQVFFAPAGLNRGGLQAFNIVDTTDRLTFQDRNDLYENRINPIATFPNEGIVVFGQKTLQYKPSALDRVNVRRLLIYAKKVIASAAKYLVFEPNNAATWQKFLNTTNPILEKVRQDQGIERFKVVMDTTVNTPDLIDRNIMTGKIFLQPTRTAEYIDLSFIITASGVSFEE